MPPSSLLPRLSPRKSFSSPHVPIVGLPASLANLSPSVFTTRQMYTSVDQPIRSFNSFNHHRLNGCRLARRKGGGVGWRAHGEGGAYEGENLCRVSVNLTRQTIYCLVAAGSAGRQPTEFSLHTLLTLGHSRGVFTELLRWIGPPRLG